VAGLKASHTKTGRRGLKGRPTESRGPPYGIAGGHSRCALPADDRPTRGPVQESRIDERVQHETTVIGTDVPEARGLAERQFHGRRLVEIGPDSIHNVCVAHASAGASGAPSAALVSLAVISLRNRELCRAPRSPTVRGHETNSSQFMPDATDSSESWIDETETKADYADPAGQRSCSLFPTPMQPAPSLLWTLEEIGLLDTIYFAFYEEIDFCRRAQRRGWMVALVPQSRIHHRRGGMWEANPELKRRRDYTCDRSQFIYMITSPDRSLAGNLKGYAITFATKAKEAMKGTSNGRIWDLVRMQFEVLGNAGALREKWKRDSALSQMK